MYALKVGCRSAVLVADWWGARTMVDWFSHTHAQGGPILDLTRSDAERKTLSLLHEMVFQMTRGSDWVWSCLDTRMRITWVSHKHHLGITYILINNCAGHCPRVGAHPPTSVSSGIMGPVCQQWLWRSWNGRCQSVDLGNSQLWSRDQLVGRKVSLANGRQDGGLLVLGDNTILLSINNLFCKQEKRRLEYFSFIFLLTTWFLRLTAVV